MQRFPKGFLWGTATAAYQIEGGARDGGRGPSIWDVFSRKPGAIENGDTGDAACDHYHRFRQDVQLMKELGLTSYRLSLSWSRLFPEGTGKPNPAGIDFYQALLDELVQAGIRPMVTLYHWDLPQALQERGGWGSRDSVDWFADYAEFCFSRFSDRVKLWVTHNEPWVTAFVGHLAGRHAPGIKDPALAVQVSHHLILSHARAVARYRACDHPDGEIGPALNLYPMYLASVVAGGSAGSAAAEDEQKAAAIADAYHNTWFLDPILKGEYPLAMMERFAKGGVAPRIGARDMAEIKASRCDFVGVNYYFRKVITAPEDPDTVLAFKEVKPEGSAYTQMCWEVSPEGLFAMCDRIRRDYGNPPQYITENGAAYPDTPAPDGSVDDPERTEYLTLHLEQARRAIESGVDLRGYYVWSLMDNFEWGFGYGRRFGILRVDYATQARHWKSSARWYKDFIAREI